MSAREPVDHLAAYLRLHGVRVLTVELREARRGPSRQVKVQTLEARGGLHACGVCGRQAEGAYEETEPVYFRDNSLGDFEESSPEELIAGVRRGFYYVDSGSFGYNPTTGDYSFQASGYWIENGSIAYPVDGITVASTSLDMLKNVDAVGSEVERRGSIVCPPLRISEMTVSG